jgi:hypothetical protein
MGGGGMLQQLQSLQEEMLKAQDEVTSMVVTATAGGAVTATVTGEKRVQSITIDPEVIDPDDVEMLQDLVVAAVNSGLEQIDAAMTEKMQPFTGGLDIPGV